MAQPQMTSETLHASCVAIDGHAVLIMGASGTGKSGLALQLLVLGAGLVADDRTILTRREDNLYVSAPDTIRGQVEARSVGILASPYAGSAVLKLVVSLDEKEQDRLPAQHTTKLMGINLPLIRRADTPHFAAAIMTWLKGTRLA